MEQRRHPTITRANSFFGSMKWWSSSNKPTAQTFGSALIATQKLRESKWFTVDESRILCAVVESGFIVEFKEGQENESVFGVVSVKLNKGKFYICTVLFIYLCF